MSPFAARARRWSAALALSAALLASPARAEPAAHPRPSVVAVAQRKCGSCHAMPAPGSRPSGWVGASVRMHERRVAMTAEEWALVREYLGERAPVLAR